MSSLKLNDIRWYTDQSALSKGEPGIRHSFAASLATAVNFIEGKLDPARLMGATGFAFRINAHEIMCPSAMSVFSFTDILPEAVEQLGYDCYYIGRGWNESELENERRSQAHELITSAIKNNMPAIVWDIADAEWGLIIGFNDENQTYHTLNCKGAGGQLPYPRLGNNGVNILSVTIPGNHNGRTENEIIRSSINMAVDHAGQKEWNDRPTYQDGLPAYDRWGEAFDKWMMLIKAGKIDNIEADICGFAKYYAEHYYSARRYAGEYLRNLMGRDILIAKASQGFSEIAESLKSVWELTPEKPDTEIERITLIKNHLKKAKRKETACIALLEQYLEKGESDKRVSISLE